MAYLDYVATTPLNKEVLEAYTSLLKDKFANPDSIHSLGIEVEQLQEKSRKLIAEMLHVESTEIIFTSGASEANNLALKGVALQYQSRGKHIITTKVEHSSVYETCVQLHEKFGFDVDYLDVNEYGVVDISQLQDLIRPDTILVSIMMVNNEIGSINPLDEIKRLLKKYPNIKLHVDMVQALGKIEINLDDVDLASFSAHKIYGLKGSGVLMKKKHIQVCPLISGGQQENGLRAGTSNACTNIVFAKTLRLALENREQKYNYVKDINNKIRKVLMKYPFIVINSNPQYCSPFILNFSVVGYKPEVVLRVFEKHDVYVSTKSACSSKKNDISRTLQAMNLSAEIGSSAIRISFSHLTDADDIYKFSKALDEAVETIKRG